MKYLLATFAILFVTITADAQFEQTSFEKIDRQSEVEEFIWSESDTYESLLNAGISDFPEDDAIYMLKRMYITTQKLGNKLRIWRMRRNVVYIQNKQAIDEFSTLSMGNIGLKGKFSDVAIRILKKNGEVIHLRRDKFIEEGDGVKIAVPGLEVGDIIDYYSFLRSQHLVAFRVYEPDEIYFAHQYPVLDHYCEFNLRTGAYFKFLSMNGAPDVKVIPQAELENNLRARVVIQDNNRPGYDVDSRWVYSLREYPVVRYSVIVGTPSNDVLASNFMNKTAKAVTSTTDVMLKAMLEGKMRSSLISTDLYKKDEAAFRKLLAENNGASDREQVEYFYHQLEHIINVSKEANYRYISSPSVVNRVADFCREKNIESNWLFVVPRVYGEASDIMVQDDIQRVLQINFKDGSQVHMTAAELYLPFGFHPYFVEGSEAFSVPNKIGASKSVQINKVKIPFSSASDNELHISVDVSLDEKGELAGFASMASKGLESTGIIREHEKADGPWYKLVTLLPKHENVTLRKQTGESDHFDMNLRELTKIDLEDIDEDDDENAYMRAQFYNWMIKSAQIEMEGRFGEDNLEEITKMTITSDGLRDGKGFGYECEVEITGMVTDAGPNKIVKIGKLIGGQVKIGQEEVDRQSDIYMPNPRQYRNTIKLKIPEGYTAEGLEALAMDVDNETGSFISTAEIVDGYVVLNSLKIYKTGVEPAENWTKMIEFLDAAHDLSEKSILLKKQ